MTSPAVRFEVVTREQLVADGVVRRLRVLPGDVLVAYPSRRLDAASLERVASVLKDQFGDVAPVLVCDDVVRFDALRPDPGGALVVSLREHLSAEMGARLEARLAATAKHLNRRLLILPPGCSVRDLEAGGVG